VFGSVGATEELKERGEEVGSRSPYRADLGRCCCRRTPNWRANGSLRSLLDPFTSAYDEAKLFAKAGERKAGAQKRYGGDHTTSSNRFQYEIDALNECASLRR